HYRASCTSRIREVPEKLCWILEGKATWLEALKRYLLMFIERIFDSRVEGGIPSLAAAPEGPDTRPRVSARAAPMISRSSLADLLKSGCIAGSGWKHSPESQLFLTERFPFA